MNTFNITVTPKLADAKDYEIEINDSVCSEADVLAALIEEMESDEVEGADACEGFEVVDWSDVPDWAQDFSVLEDLMPAYANSHNEIEIFEAAKEADIEFSDVDEAYNGQHDSDEDFAQEMADQLGAVDKNASWPMNCIDWEQAASELMYDYSEANGYYFRNL